MATTKVISILSLVCPLALVVVACIKATAADQATTRTTAPSTQPDPERLALINEDINIVNKLTLVLSFVKDVKSAKNAIPSLEELSRRAREGFAHEKALTSPQLSIGDPQAQRYIKTFGDSIGRLYLEKRRIDNDANLRKILSSELSDIDKWWLHSPIEGINGRELPASTQPLLW